MIKGKRLEKIKKSRNQENYHQDIKQKMSISLDASLRQQNYTKKGHLGSRSDSEVFKVKTKD